MKKRCFQEYRVSMGGMKLQGARLRVFATALIALAAMAPATTWSAEKAGTGRGKPLPRVLLLGDSISGGYAGPVTGMLKGKAHVQRASNGGTTIAGLDQIEKILGEAEWDVIHFNWGLHDMTWQFRMKPEDRGIAKYEDRLERLVVRLKKTHAKLIWGSTTPWCPEVYQYIVDRFKRELRLAGAEEGKWRDAALRVMKKHDVQVNDLYDLMLPDLKKYLNRPDDIHFNAEGSRRLGKQIADVVLHELQTPAATAGARDADKTGSGAKRSVKQLQEDFLKLKFGMFIHYNMATHTGDEWVVGYHKPSEFNPGVETINTDAWADAAVSAGMKYGVLTVKHVAGFCLWDSKHTTYDVMHPDCPYKKDLVAQFVKSFKSRGLKVGFHYHWRHPGFRDPNKHKVLPPECDPATHSLKQQNEFQKKQIAELLEKYPDVFYFWNDALDDKVMPAQEILDHERGVRPNILTSSNWWSWGKKGRPYLDIAVKELRHFPEDNTAPGETCWKLERTWFWKKGTPSGSAKGVMGNMAKAHARNSNFLLNVGPDRSGRIVPGSLKTLAEVGKLRASKAVPAPSK